MKLIEFPLEIKLIIYEYYDPKDKHIVIDDISFKKIIYIQSENMEKNFFLNYCIIFANWESSDFIWRDSTIEHFFWRKSQVDSCFEKLMTFKK